LLTNRGNTVPLTSFERGKLKIAAHVREELDRSGIQAQSIQCKSGGTHTHPDTARLIVTVNGTPAQLDFTTHEVEDCEDIVAGDVWRKIAALVDRLK
jgi:galactitol-specific phosphotransferase system IIB component